MFQPDPRTSSSLQDHGGYETPLVIQTSWSTQDPNFYKKSLSHSTLVQKGDPTSFTIGQYHDNHEFSTSSPFHYVLPTFLSLSGAHNSQQMGVFIPGGKGQTLNNLQQTLEQYNNPVPNSEPVISMQDRDLDLAYPDDNAMLHTEEEGQITSKSFALLASPALSFQTDEGFCYATPSPEIPKPSIWFTTNQRTDKPGGLCCTQAPPSSTQQSPSKPPIREEERQTSPKPVSPSKAPYKQTSPPDIPRLHYHHAHIPKRKVPPSCPGSPQPDLKCSKSNSAPVSQPNLESHVTSTSTIPGEGKESDRPSKSVRIDPFPQIQIIPRNPSLCNTPSPLSPVLPLTSEAVTLATEPPIAVLQESDGGFVTEMSHLRALDLTSHPPSTATDDDSALVDELANDAPPPQPKPRPTGSQSRILQDVRQWTQQLSGIDEAGVAGKLKEDQRSLLGRVLRAIRVTCKNSLITVGMLDLTGLDTVVAKFADKYKSVQVMDGSTVDIAKKIGRHFASLRAAAAER